MLQKTIFALHGFGGSSRSWDEVARELDPQRYRLHAVDLPGHGSNSELASVDFESTMQMLSQELAEVSSESGPVLLAGYSLGGRLALHLALNHPELISALVMISSTAGIEEESKRAQRRAQDELLAQKLETEGLQAFTDYWLGLKLWQGDPAEALLRQRQELLQGDPRGLARALRGLSPGAVPAVWDRLDSQATPLLNLAGSRDVAYCALGRRMQTLVANPLGQVVFPAAGHGLLREVPSAVALALVGL